MAQIRILYAIFTVASTEFILGLWAGWPSWALVRRPQNDTAASLLHITEHTWAVASFDLVNLITAWPAAMLVNSIGRKLCLVLTGVVMSVSFGLLLAPGKWAVFAARSIGGVGKSIAYASVPGFLAEISSDRTRGRLAVVAASMDSLGMLAAMFVGPRVSYNVMNAFSMVVALVFLLAISRVPETPYYLLTKKRMDEARRAFKWYRWSGGRASPAEREYQLNRMNTSVQNNMSEPGTFHELFTDNGNRTALLLVCGACFAQRAGGVSCVFAYSTTTLPRDGPIRPENVAAVFAAVRLLFTVLGGSLIDRFGRRPLLIGSHMSVATVLAVYAYFLYGGSTWTSGSWVPSLCVFLFTVFYSLGPGIVPGTLIGEMFPANVKSHAVCVVAVMSSLAAFITTSTYLTVADAFGVYTMYLAFVTINVLWAMCVYVFLFETKGMSLSAIQTVLDEYNTSSSEEDDARDTNASTKLRTSTV